MNTGYCHHCGTTALETTDGRVLCDLTTADGTCEGAPQPTRRCNSCGDTWQGAHSCDAPRTLPRPGDPRYHYGPGAPRDAVIYGP